MMNERLTLGEAFVNVQVSPVYINEAFLGVVSVLRDITREVEVDRMKSEFVSGVSHEFRTPLTSIKGYNDLLLMGAAGQVGDMQKNWLQTIRDNVERLTVLVEDVLAISKIDAGRERLKIEEVNLTRTVENVLETLRARPRHKERQLEVVVNIPPDMPAFQADAEKLSRILGNIIDNAFNYTQDGGRVEISGKLEADGKRVLITVADTGVGIPESFYEDIWRRFQRYEEHALNLEVAGTGLGLSIVKELVEMHAGRVWFESVVDQGTTFYVQLPTEQLDFMGNPLRRTGTVRQIADDGAK
jgi:signal transduction histidine kinase